MELDELLDAHENQTRIQVWDARQEGWISGYIVEVSARPGEPRDPGCVVWTAADEFLQAPRQWIKE